jgi:glucose-6-phosphate-specific signal transduction histidine kinase
MTAPQPGLAPEVQQHDEKLEARVAARTEELSTLSTHLIRMMESERSQLAKELHDELGGLITAAKMDMAWLQAHIGNSLDPASEEKFRSVVQMLNQAMTLKRRVVESLRRHQLLDQFGLPVVIAQPLRRENAPRGHRVRRDMRKRSSTLEPAAQLTLFRVHRKALANLLARGTANTWSWRSNPRAIVTNDGGRRRAGDGFPRSCRALAGMRTA